MQQISIELIEAAINGEEIIITKDERPVVKLVPVPPEKKRYPAKAGSAKGLVTIAEDFDEPLEDFFDRLLIPQSLVEQVPILSVDSIFDAYQVRRLW